MKNIHTGQCVLGNNGEGVFQKKKKRKSGVSDSATGWLSCRVSLLEVLPSQAGHVH